MLACERNNSLRQSVTNGVKLSVNPERALSSNLMNIARAIKVVVAIHLERLVILQVQPATAGVFHLIRDGRTAERIVIAAGQAHHMVALQVLHMAVRHMMEGQQAIAADQHIARNPH